MHWCGCMKHSGGARESDECEWAIYACSIAFYSNEVILTPHQEGATVVILPVDRNEVLCHTSFCCYLSGVVVPWVQEQCPGLETRVRIMSLRHRDENRDDLYSVGKSLELQATKKSSSRLLSRIINYLRAYFFSTLI